MTRRMHRAGDFFCIWPSPRNVAYSGHEFLRPTERWFMSLRTCTRISGIARWGALQGNWSAPIEPVNLEAPNPDLELLRRIAAGDSAALGELYDTHSGTLFALAFRILNNYTEAEDVLQEVFVQLWDKAGSFDAALGRPLGWLVALTRNKAIDRLRSSQRRAQLLEAASSELSLDAREILSSTLDSAGASDEAAVVRSALGRLPDEQRKAIEMAFFGGMTQTEIATALGEPLGTIKARIRRGMLKLREELAGSLGLCPTT